MNSAEKNTSNKCCARLYTRKRVRNNCVYPRNAAVIDYDAMDSASRNVNGFVDATEANVNERERERLI